MSIPALNSETEQLFMKAESNGARTLCISGCHANSGVTSLTMALAERYLLSGYKTLLIDMNLHRPSFAPLIENDGLNGDALIVDKHSNRCFQGVCCDLDKTSLLEMRQGDFLTNQLKYYLENYDRIVIDTSPLLNQNRGNIPANLVAAACDCTLLCVEAGQTTKSQIVKALELLDFENVNVLGTVLNQKQQPSLVQELQREVNRLKWVPQRFRKRLHRKVSEYAFLQAHH
jgi:Mrp family chromosome partitioning ATPase